MALRAHCYGFNSCQYHTVMSPAGLRLTLRYAHGPRSDVAARTGTPSSNTPLQRDSRGPLHHMQRHRVHACPCHGQTLRRGATTRYMCPGASHSCSMLACSHTCNLSRVRAQGRLPPPPREQRLFVPALPVRCIPHPMCSRPTRSRRLHETGTDSTPRC